MSKDILLVDDSSEVRELFTMIFSTIGYRVTACADGREALVRFAERQYPVVLSDVQMPYIDGKTLLGVLKKKYRNSKVLIMSHTFFDKRELMLLGALDAFEKTIDRDKLVQRVAAACENKRVAQRFRIERPALINRNIRCSTVNISCDGMLLNCPVPVKEGTMVHVQITVDNASGPLGTAGRVVRNIRTGAGNQTAIYFLDPIGHDLAADLASASSGIDISLN